MPGFGNRDAESPTDGLGYYPQDIAVRPTNLEDFAADWSPEAIAVRDDLQLGDNWLYAFARLSGGERKRVQIACALTLRPDVLILDEPTNHLDLSSKKTLASMLAGYPDALVVVSHDEWFLRLAGFGVSEEPAA